MSYLKSGTHKYTLSSAEAILINLNIGGRCKDASSSPKLQQPARKLKVHHVASFVLPEQTNRPRHPVSPNHKQQMVLIPLFCCLLFNLRFCYTPSTPSCFFYISSFPIFVVPYFWYSCCFPLPSSFSVNWNFSFRHYIIGCVCRAP